MPRKKLTNKNKAKRKIIGERLNELIQENGITQNKLARLLEENNFPKISQSSISGIINGSRPLHEEDAETILAVLPNDLSYRKEWLLGIDDDKTEAMRIIRQTTERLRKNKGSFRKIDFHPQLSVLGQFLSSIGFDFAYSNKNSDSKLYVSHKGHIYMIPSDTLDQCLNEITDFANWKMQNLISSAQKME